MTDYGRGSGSEPWHPEDPLFGDVYDPSHGYQQQGQQSPQQYPQPQDGGWQDPYGTGQHPQYPQGYPQQQYPQGQQQYPQAQYPQGQQPQQQYGQPQQQYPQAPQPGQQESPQQYSQHPQQQGYQQQAPYDPYDTGSHQTTGYGHQDPYGGQQPQDPYGRPDLYGQNGYPPPQQPQYRQQPGQPGQGQPQPGQQMPGRQMPGQPVQGQQMPGQPMPGQGQPQPGQPQPGRPVRGQGPGAGQDQQPGRPGPRTAQTGHPQEPGVDQLTPAPDKTGSWDTDDEEDPRGHAFFSDGDDEDEDDSPSTPAASGRRSGKEQPKTGKKRRSGCACSVVMLVLVGVVGGGGYFGYTVYESHFGPAPDYSGQGTGDVQVVIPKGASATTMGNLLKKAGVVKSVDAFVDAANKNKKSLSIQSGVYILKGQMPAAAAITMMLDPKSQNAMIVREGERAVDVFTDIDKNLALAAGTTRKAAHAQVKNLGLPAWAITTSKVREPLDGFLFPSRYSIAKGMKPEDVLRAMVKQANQEYTQLHLEEGAKKEGLDGPLELITVASMVQAEGKTPDDFRKMAKVIYNRLTPGQHETNGLLQFDSTYNYAKNQSDTSISIKDVQSFHDPYNTYVAKGLPPGPIGSPGLVALQAVTEPDSGDWWYFLTLDNKTTKFVKTAAEWSDLKNQYNAR